MACALGSNSSKHSWHREVRHRLAHKHNRRAHLRPHDKRWPHQTQRRKRTSNLKPHRLSQMFRPMKCPEEAAARPMLLAPLFVLDRVAVQQHHLPRSAR